MKRIDIAAADRRRCQRKRQRLPVVPVAACLILASNSSRVCGFSASMEPFLNRSRSPRCLNHERPATCLAESNAVQPRNSKEKKKKSTNNTKPQKKKQTGQSVDDLVAQMGLQPVPKKTRAKPEKPTNANNSRRPSLQAQLEYARNGHAVLRNHLDPSRLPLLRRELLGLGRAQELSAWRQKVQVAAGSDSVPPGCDTLEDCRRALDRLGVPSDQLPFLQYFNTWTTLACVKDLAQELAPTAAVLLDVPSVRLYQDSFFWKRAHDGPTPWHVDARMAPFDTTAMLTLWIPLHDVPRDGSALRFVSKSHADFALPFWNPYNTSSDDDDNNNNQWNHLEERYQHHEIVHYMPLNEGDLTVHSGWTLHCADGGPTSKDRLALAISYVDARAPVRPNVLSESDHGDDEDQWSYAGWVKEVPPGQEFDHPSVPIVWPVPSSII